MKREHIMIAYDNWPGSLTSDKVIGEIYGIFNSEKNISTKA